MLCAKRKALAKILCGKSCVMKHTLDNKDENAKYFLHLTNL